MLVCYNPVQIPGVAIEIGWSEGVPQFHRDKRLWLMGGQPEAQLVIVLRWTTISETPVQQGRGVFEIWERDAGNTPYLKQGGAIFPAPANAATQVIPITRAHIGPAHVFSGRNGVNVWNLNVDILRTWASAAIVNVGFQPA
ncbi:hypothetical protein Plec18167_005095 [Paecilomyces lecythidis]|uniref:Uncharacterized protein n=1 Tax=Paecilomyces lecythidis TaxID=3004212 RepID=A0ABR3XMJ3_9EURO